MLIIVTISSQTKKENDHSNFVKISSLYGNLMMEFANIFANHVYVQIATCVQGVVVSA